MTHFTYFFLFIYLFLLLFLLLAVVDDVNFISFLIYCINTKIYHLRVRILGILSDSTCL